MQKKATLLLSSGSDGVNDTPIAQFKDYMSYAQVKVEDIITVYGSENQSDSKLNEVKEFAKSLKR